MTRRSHLSAKRWQSGPYHARRPGYDSWVPHCARQGRPAREVMTTLLAAALAVANVTRAAAADIVALPGIGPLNACSWWPVSQIGATCCRFGRTASTIRIQTAYRRHRPRRHDVPQPDETRHPGRANRSRPDWPVPRFGRGDPNILQRHRCTCAAQSEFGNGPSACARDRAAARGWLSQGSAVIGIQGDRNNGGRLTSPASHSSCLVCRRKELPNEQAHP
jgi:hypothetical protein